MFEFFKIYKIKKYIEKNDYNSFKYFFLNNNFSQRGTVKIWDFITESFIENNCDADRYYSYIFSNSNFDYFIFSNKNFQYYFNLFTKLKEEEIVIKIINNYSYFIRHEYLYNMFFRNFYYKNIKVIDVLIDKNLISIDIDIIKNIYSYMDKENISKDNILILSKHLIKDKLIMNYIENKDPNMCIQIKNENFKYKISSF